MRWLSCTQAPQLKNRALLAQLGQRTRRTSALQCIVHYVRVLYINRVSKNIMQNRFATNDTTPAPMQVLSTIAIDSPRLPWKIPRLSSRPLSAILNALHHQSHDGFDNGSTHAVLFHPRVHRKGCHPKYPCIL